MVLAGLIGELTINPFSLLHEAGGVISEAQHGATLPFPTLKKQVAFKFPSQVVIMRKVESASSIPAQRKQVVLTLEVGGL